MIRGALRNAVIARPLFLYDPSRHLHFFASNISLCLLDLAFRANVELPTASENVVSLDGTWKFALHETPQQALASKFFGKSFQEIPSTSFSPQNEPNVRSRGEVRGADGRWSDTTVPGCWQMKVQQELCWLQSCVACACVLALRQWTRDVLQGNVVDPIKGDRGRSKAAPRI